MNAPSRRFAGFYSPNYTMVPDQLFDELLPDLSGAELKVLLYIVRRTFGFKKDADSISLSQMLQGIRTRDGRMLDHGTGLSKKTLLEALRSLEEMGCIVTERRQSAERGNEPTVYRLNVLSPLGGETSPPLGEKVHQGGGGEIPPSPWGNFSPTQETVLQETDSQETDLSKFRIASNAQNAVATYDEARRAIVDYIADFAREMADQASVKASTTRAVNLFRRSGLALDAFCERMCAARAIVQERTAAIKMTTTEPGKPFPTKRKMGYFFAVLEDTVGLKGPTAGAKSPGEGRGDRRDEIR